MLEALAAAAPAALKLIGLAIDAAAGKKVDPAEVKKAMEDVHAATAAVIQAVDDHIAKIDKLRHGELDEVPAAPAGPPASAPPDSSSK